MHEDEGADAARGWHAAQAGVSEPGEEAAFALLHEVVGACFEVSNTLGAGFLEKVYERALIHELRLRGHTVESQVPLPVCYEGHMVGDFYVDVLVDGLLIIELKCCERLSSDLLAQALNYVRASGHPVALLVNFQHPKLEWRRVVNRF